MASVITSLLYLVFSVAFVVIYFMIFDVHTNAKIYQSVSHRFTKVPWSGKLYLKDVADPGDAYEWLNNVWRAGVRDLEVDDSTVALNSLNQVQFGRLTLKRYAFVDNDSDKFKGPYKKKLGIAKMDASQDNGSAEDKRSFGTKYKYEAGQGYNNAGGYVIYINPDEEQEKVDKEIEDAKKNGWFDLRFGSLVAEIIVFNGNVKKFLHLTVIMEASFSGVIDVRTHAATFDLSLYDFKSSRALENVIRVLLEAVVITLTIYFLRKEQEDMADDVKAYLMNPMCVFDIICIIISFSCTVMYYYIVLFSDAFAHFSFPLPRGDTNLRIHVFNQLSSVSSQFYSLQVLVALSVCIIFIRCVALLGNLKKSWGLLFRTLAQGKYFFLYFIFIFMLLFIGFSLSMHFLFGASTPSMNTFGISFLSTLRIMLGDGLYKDMERGDALMALPYYYVFQLLFSFVLINVFLSIIVSSYDKEMKEAKEKALSNVIDEDPLGKVLNRVKDSLVSKFGFLQQLTMAKYLVGGSTSGAKINYETVCKLRARTRRDIYPGSWECCLVLSMLVVFITLNIYQARILTTYQLNEDLEHSLLTRTWKGKTPARTMSYDSIQELEDVYNYTKHVLLEELYSCTGTADSTTTCSQSSSRYETRSGFQLSEGPQQNSHEYQPGIGYVPKKPKPQNEALLLPRVEEWNVGITNANFLRMTIQVACFRRSNDHLFKAGDLHVNVTEQSDCADSDCMEQNKGKMCLTSQGKIIDLQRFSGKKVRPYNGTSEEYSLQFTYEYQKEGSYRDLGGYSIGLGKTKKEAERVLDQLFEDDWFSSNVVSIVFDWTLYNGNVDLFMHQAMEFGLDPTDFLQKNIKTSVFPLNIFTEGSKSIRNKRKIVEILTGVYGGLVAFYILLFLYQLLHQYLISTTLQRPISSRLVDLVRNDPWNIIAAISVALNILVCFIFLSFWRLKDDYMSLPSPVDDEGADYITLGDMQKLGFSYMSFFQISGINSFFMTVMLLKYLSEVHTEVTYVKQDQQPLEELDIKWDPTNKLLVVIGIRELEKGCAAMSGITPGWVIHHIDGDSVLEMYTAFEKEHGGNVESYFSHKLRRPQTQLPLKPLVITFRSQTGAIGTFMRTLRKTVGQVMNFTIVMLLAMIGFIAMFYFEYGIQIKQFGSATSTFMTLFRYMIGDFDIESIIVFDKTLAIFNFIIFQLIFYFVLSNMFLATMIPAWREIRLEVMDGFINNLSALTISARRTLRRSMKMCKGGNGEGVIRKKEEMVAIDSYFWMNHGALQYMDRLTERGIVELDADKGIFSITEPENKMFADQFQKSQTHLATILANNTSDKVDRCALLDELTVDFDRPGKGAFLKTVPTADMHGTQSARLSNRVSNAIRKTLRLKVSDNEKKGKGFLPSNKYIKDSVYRLTDRLQAEMENASGPSIAEEIWLDALIVCMENAGVTSKAQKLFRRERQHEPVSAEQQQKFEQMKEKMAKELRCLFKYAQIKAAVQYQTAIGEAAEAKVKLLREQSMVFNEYLQKLEAESAKLDDEIQELRNNTRFVQSQMHMIL